MKFCTRIRSGEKFRILMVLHMSTGKWLCSATYALLNAALRTHRFSYIYEIWHTCVSCRDKQKSLWPHMTQTQQEVRNLEVNVTFWL